MRFYPILGVLSSFLLGAPLAAAAQGSLWDALLDQGAGARVDFGVSLRDPEPYVREAGQVFVTADLAKLFTAGAALERLGPEFVFETRVEWKTPFPRDLEKISDLTIIGSGDPTWGMGEWNVAARARPHQPSQIERIARSLYERGVRRIHGGLRLEAQDARWLRPAAPVGWLARDLATCAGALPQAFNLQLNCATFVVQDPTHGRWKELGLDIPVWLDLSPGSVTSLRAEADGVGFRVRGTWSERSGPVSLRLPVQDTTEWIRNQLTAAIEAKGIRFLPVAAREDEAARPLVLASHSFALQSPPLKELIVPVLKNNLNLPAESLYLAMGQRMGGTSADLLAGAQHAMREYLGTHLPGQDAVAVWDGSGLSRSNTVTPAAVLQLLEALRGGPGFSAIWDGLSVAGVDGSLGRRMRGSAAEGILRAHVGAAPGNYHLAGYVPRYDSRGEAVELFPFVVMARARPGLRGAASRAQDRVGAALVKAINY